MRMALCAAWLLVIGAGLAIILDYDNTSGAVGKTPGHWPAKAPIPLEASRDTLVMFAHPKCPCTRASMDELNRIMTRCDGRITGHVFFMMPRNFDDSWVQTGLWKSALMIPNVTAQKDPGGMIAQMFGAETSGDVMLYAPNGRLLFSGGITGSRGHAGDNAGEDAIVALAMGASAALNHTMVYGCSLLNNPSSPSLTNDSISKQ
jgi:hypothetical protein